MITPLAKYKAFQSICHLVGRDEDDVAGLIRGKAANGKRVTVDFTNRDTGLMFTLIVDKFSWHDEHAVRMYERHPEGSIEIMAKKILLSKPLRARPTPKRKTDPGLSEIVGVIIIIGIAVGAGSAFYYSTIDRVDTITSENIVDIYGLRLIAFIPDDGSTETDTVYAEMTVSLLYVEEVTLGGDVLSVNSGGTVLFDNVGFAGTALNPMTKVRYAIHAMILNSLMTIVRQSRARMVSRYTILADSCWKKKEDRRQRGHHRELWRPEPYSKHSG